jgi:hypothetical protein
MITFKYIRTRDNGDATSWANGGWGRMTYFITFEEANDNEIQIATND